MTGAPAAAGAGAPFDGFQALSVLQGVFYYRHKTRLGIIVGIVARAKATGGKLDRKPTLTPHRRQEAKRQIKARKESVGEIARSYNVSRWAILRG